MLLTILLIIVIYFDQRSIYVTEVRRDMYYLHHAQYKKLPSYNSMMFLTPFKFNFGENNE